MATRASRTRRSEPEDRYLELFQRFPLRPLRSEDDLDRAIAIVDGLLDQTSLDQDEEDYLDVLGDLIKKYEQAHHPLPPVSDAEMLRYLVEANGTSQAEVAAGAEVAESTISEILSGRRKLSRRHIESLATFFHVDPGVFLTHRSPASGRRKKPMDIVEKAAKAIARRTHLDLPVARFISISNAFAADVDLASWRAFQEMVQGKKPWMAGKEVVATLNHWGRRRPCGRHFRLRKKA